MIFLLFGGSFFINELAEVLHVRSGTTLKIGGKFSEDPHELHFFSVHMRRRPLHGNVAEVVFSAKQVVNAAFKIICVLDQSDCRGFIFADFNH